MAARAATRKVQPLSVFAEAQRSEAEEDEEKLAKRGATRKVQPLGARFDRILDRIFQQISQIFANLRRLYLGCIEADFCNQILILQHFSRSTRISFLRTAPNSKSLQIFVEKFLQFSKFRSKICYYLRPCTRRAPIGLWRC